MLEYKYFKYHRLRWRLQRDDMYYDILGGLEV